MFRGHRKKVRLLFGAVDIALLAVAFFAAYLTRESLPFTRTFFLDAPTIALLLSWSALVWVVLGYWWEIYDRLESGDVRAILRDAFRQCLMGIASVVMFQYLWRWDLSRAFLAMYGLLAWVALTLFRLSAPRLLIRGEAHFILIAGTGANAIRLARELERAAPFGIRLEGFLFEGPDAPTLDKIELTKSYPVHSLGALPALLSQHVIDEIVFAVDSKRLAELEDVLLLCDEEGVRTRVSIDLFPHVNSQVYLDRIGSLPLLTFSATPHDEIRLLIKRVTDVALAGAALVFLWPLMLIIAALIRATSPGPAIFRQQRCGLNGRRFTFYKFRSMCEDAEGMRASLAHLSERQLALKIKNDPRITGIGRWLRKFSIDEWPQLWNVVKGDMSLVGPRPPVPEEVAQYERWQRRRLRMRPGLTCLWAVEGRDNVDFETWMRLDMQYIDTWSLGLDWKILLRTVPQVLSGRGAN